MLNCVAQGHTSAEALVKGKQALLDPVLLSSWASGVVSCSCAAVGPFAAAGSMRRDHIPSGQPAGSARSPVFAFNQPTSCQHIRTQQHGSGVASALNTLQPALDWSCGSLLLQVYATLTAAVLLAAVGIAFNITFHIGGVLATLAGFGSLTWLAFTPATPQNQVKKAACRQELV